MPPVLGTGVFLDVAAEPGAPATQRRHHVGWTIEAASRTDAVVRAMGVAAVLWNAPWLLYLSIFISDSGTPAAMRMFKLAMVTILVGSVAVLFLCAWPQKVERWVPGPPRLRFVVARLPIYTVLVLAAAGFLASVSGTLMAMVP
jgi:hypothetical protein